MIDKIKDNPISYTTEAVGEEGGDGNIPPELQELIDKIKDNPPRYTTLAVGEEGGDGNTVTTLATGEEGGSDYTVTTDAVGEEGGEYSTTTEAVGEEGGDSNIPPELRELLDKLKDNPPKYTNCANFLTNSKITLQSIQLWRSAKKAAIATYLLNFRNFLIKSKTAI